MLENIICKKYSALMEYFIFWFFLFLWNILSSGYLSLLDAIAYKKHGTILDFLAVNFRSTFFYIVHKIRHHKIYSCCSHPPENDNTLSHRLSKL